VFTGITRGTFEVTRVERDPDLIRYTVDLQQVADGLERGASVAIDGVCQTVVVLDGTRATFEAVEETLARTTLSSLSEGRRVSVERALRAGDEMGGHEVSGHVIGTARVARVLSSGQRRELHLSVPREWEKYLFFKGFIAIDGSSLTIGEVTRPPSETMLVVHLVPETVKLTNLGELRAGDRVNVELDARTVAIVDTVERVLAERASPDSSPSSAS
jgi:riboflavin synthase